MPLSRLFRSLTGHARDAAPAPAPTPAPAHEPPAPGGPLALEVLAAVRRNAALAPAFVAAQGVALPKDGLTPAALDAAFAHWHAHGDRAAYPDEMVEQLVGAAFGEHCVRALGMCWIHVVEERGTAIAVEGAERPVRAFPFNAVSRRLAAPEAGFLVALEEHLRAQGSGLSSDRAGSST